MSLIDPRVHYVGMTALRTLKLDAVPQDEIYVLQDRGKPVAVLVPYELYMDMQGKRWEPESRPSPEAAKEHP